MERHKFTCRLWDGAWTVNFHVLIGGNHQLTAAEQEIAARHYKPNLTDTCHELANSQEHVMTSDQEMLNSCQQLPGNQHQQLPMNHLHHELPQVAIRSDELQCGRLDGVMVHHGYLEDLCPVCNDRVSGYHYGLQTCESCKGNRVVIEIIITIKLTKTHLCY